LGNQDFDIVGTLPSQDTEDAETQTEEVGTTETEATFPGTYERGDIISCDVTPYDPVSENTLPVTAELEISNATPVVDIPQFDTTTVYTDDIISVTATGSDADDDVFVFTYSWYKKDAQTGVESTVQTGSDNTLDGSLFVRDDVVFVNVSATDATNETGETVSSEEITILNTSPLAPSISIDPKFPLSDQDLVCRVDQESVDIDGDSSTYTVTWTKNGSDFSTTETTTITGDTISQVDLVSADRWVCTVTPNDGTNEGSSSEAYVSIGGGNLFDGTFGSTWEKLTDSPSNLFSLMTYQSQDFSLLWNAAGDYLSYYNPVTNTWAYITEISPYLGLMKSMAPVQDMLYMVRNEAVYQFNPNTETWTTLNTYTGGDDSNQTTSDYQGRVYGHAATGEIIEYDIESNTVQQYPTGMGSLYETRIAYDPISEALFFGSYSEADFYRFDFNTQAVTELTPIPEECSDSSYSTESDCVTANKTWSNPDLSTIFCGDRSGHIYAAGGYSGTTIYQYTIATDSWSQLPDLDFIDGHGNNGSCTVSEDGHLYVGNGTFLRLHRISLGSN
jgi:hypothetical protein